MTKRQAGTLNILISLAFAAAMIAGSWHFAWESNSVWIGLLIALWFIPFSILSAWTRPGSLSREVRCLRNRLSGKPR